MGAMLVHYAIMVILNIFFSYYKYFLTTWSMVKSPSYSSRKMRAGRWYGCEACYAMRKPHPAHQALHQAPSTKHTAAHYKHTASTPCPPSTAAPAPPLPSFVINPQTPNLALQFVLLLCLILTTSTIVCHLSANFKHSLPTLFCIFENHSNHRCHCLSLICKLLFPTYVRHIDQ